MYSLKIGMRKILFLICGADEKHANETNTKGVVGHIGNNNPTAPRPRNEKPSPVRRNVLMRNVSPRKHK